MTKQRQDSPSSGGSHLEVGDIFRRYGGDYQANHGVSIKQHAVMYDIEHCRSSIFGYHLDVCDSCDYREHAYNSCRNRHCPKCQGIARRKWVQARLDDLLPIPYYHVVFTLPHKINPLSLFNREIIYELLFDCAAQTLLAFGWDPKHLGALIGFYGILHTWGGKLWQHLHLHFIVTGGGLSPSGQWVELKYKSRFLFPVCALSDVFRGKFIEGLKAAYAEGGLKFPEELKHLEQEDRFEHWLDDLVSHRWVVFSKTPFAGPEEVVRYIGRYTHRVAISNHRLISMDNGEVRFSYKDYKDKKVLWKETTLRAGEFIKRFLMHVLPEGFHRIRHYGLLANGRCKAKVEQIRRLLGSESAGERLAEDYGGITCPVCQKGRLIPILVVHRFGMVVLSGFLSLFRPKEAWDTS